MDKSTANYIDGLLYDSGLFPSKTKALKDTICFDFSDEVILITGAAGSIGSGLTKQLARSKYKKLVLVDIAESPLYELIKTLEFENVEHISFILLDITHEASLTRLFETHKPTMVIHAAAYKHVPLMESNPSKAIELNIFGTKQLADLSNACNVKKFLFISTDKAVNPIGIMGMSKLIGENYLKQLNAESHTTFVIARFGNIFGSNGSVIPLIKKQIEFGYPITITHNKITRYFISKHKACKLILKLASFKVYNATVFTFKMGEPIKIMDIVNRLLLLYNLEKSPDIKTIGLRPGEKLNEHLISKNETLVKTDEPNILAIKQNEILKPERIDFNELEHVTPCMTSQNIKKLLNKYL
jgi:FlaA1/EpsC-like NDP-sugar epimerase